LRMNVTKDSDIKEAYDSVEAQCEKHGLKLWAIVNNAGVIACGEIEWGDLNNQLKQVLDVNVLGCVKVTREFLPLIKKSNGKLEFMNSKIRINENLSI